MTGPRAVATLALALALAGCQRKAAPPAAQGGTDGGPAVGAPDDSSVLVAASGSHVALGIVGWDDGVTTVGVRRSHDGGATRAYHGHFVSLEWQS